MTGIFLLFVVGLWLALVIWLVPKLTSVMRPGAVKTISQFVLFSVLLAAPLADEIVGGIQFSQLCDEKARITIDAANIQGRTVWFGESQRTLIKLGTIQVTQAKRSYVDAKTQDPIYHYYRLEARGGLFIRSLGISEGDSPLIFPALCQPKNIESIDAQLGLTRINRPTSN